MTNSTGPRKISRLRAAAILLAIGLALAALATWMDEDDTDSLILSNDSIASRSQRKVRTGSPPYFDGRAPQIPEKGESAPLDEPDIRGTLIVQVVSPEGFPVEGATVLLVDASGKRAIRPTDSLGRAQFEHPGEGHLIARSLGRLPVLRTLEPDVGDYTLKFAEGLHITGHLLVNGSPPGRPLDFSAEIVDSEFKSRFLRAIHRQSHSADLAPIELQCNEAGEYQVTGLSEGSRVMFHLPVGLRMAPSDPDRGRTVRYTSPLRENLVLDLQTTKRTLLVGRCIDRRGHALSNVPVELRVSTKNRSGKVFPPRTWQSTRSDTEGRFTLWLDEAKMMHRIQVVACCVGMEIARDIPREGPKTQDLSEFIFPVSRNIQVRIIDEESHPINGAKVGTPNGFLVRTSDTHGAVSFPVIPGDPLTLHVAAAGFRFAQEQIETDTSAIQTIRMTRANLTTFSLQHLDGTPAIGQRMRISFDASPFREPQAMSSPVMRALRPDLRFLQVMGEHVIEGRTDSSGELRVFGIAPHRTARVTIHGFAGVRLASSTIRITGLDGQRVRLTLRPNETITVRGHVVDIGGRLLSDAVVVIGQSSTSGGNVTYTNEDGQFRYEDVAFASAYIRVGKVGYRRVTRFIENIKDIDGDLEFRLRPAARCRLLVKQADGGLMKKAHVELPWVHNPGMGPVVIQQAPGTFDIVDIGDEPCHPVIYGPDGKKRKITIRPDVDTLKIVRWD